MHRTTRRKALAAGAGAFLIVPPATAFGSQANSAVSLGILGSGNRGSYVGKIFVEDSRARLAALCDVNPEKIDRAKTVIPGAGTVPVVKDYRELLARSSIDAVLIASPVYLHPEHFEAATLARKHVFCEKPAGADVAGVKRLLRAALQADASRCIQFGFQQRHSPEYLAAERILRSGGIGDLCFMRSNWLIAGGNAKAPRIENMPEEQKRRQWYPWVRYSGDIIVEQHCHGVDVLNWFAQARPLRATGSGGRSKKRVNGDTMDHLDVTFEYPNGLRGHLAGAQCGAQGMTDVSENFWGTEGYLETTRNHYRRLHDGKPPEVVKGKRDVTIDAVEIFLGNVLAGRRVNEAPHACESTFTSLLGRLAIYDRREVAWDDMMRSG
jgi:myo-inositol 2-dehydrogenase / D-chiro-inositol 1-dehydrogenase